MADIKKEKDFDKKDAKSENTRDSRRKKSGKQKPKVAKDFARNHLEWYVPDSNMSLQSSMIPFNYRLGDQLNYSPQLSNTTSWLRRGMVMPGIMRIGYVPTLGVCDSKTSAANMSGLGIFSAIMRSQTSTQPFDATDVLIHFGAMDSIYSAIAWMIRVFAVVNYYNKYSLYTPQHLVGAMGVTWNSDLPGKIVNYTLRLNNIIQKVNTIPVPKVFPLFDRHLYLASQLFLDEDDPWGQIYFFNPEIFYKFSYDDNNAGQLEVVKWAPTSTAGTKPLEDYFTILEDMVDAIYGDADTGRISGVVRRAVSEAQVYQVSTVPVGISTAPVYDPEMLEQIHNADLTGLDANGFTSNITQTIVEYADHTDSWITQTITLPTYTTPLDEGTVWSGERLFDLHRDPNPEWVIRGSRLKVGSVANDGTAKGFGTEICTYGTMFKINYVSGSPMIYATQFYDWQTMTTTQIADLITFSMAPIVMVATGTEPNKIAVPIGNFDHTTTMSLDAINQLHQVATLGEWNTGMLNKVGLFSR